MPPDRAAPERMRVLVASDLPVERLARAFRREGHEVVCSPVERALETVTDEVEAVIVRAPTEPARELARRLKTRFQLPLLPVVVLGRRPRTHAEGATPDAWLSAFARTPAVVRRVEELVRIRRAEGEMVRLNTALAELAAENGRLFDRARRDAEATTVLLRELQHRVRNNLASIQALLVLERHRTPARPLAEALDVAIARLRSMAALQDTLEPNAPSVELAGVAQSVARGALEVFGATGDVTVTVRGSATLEPRRASAVAIVLNELITNALKHAGARDVVVEIGAPGDRIEIAIVDDGCGMPPSPPAGSGLMIVRAVLRNELDGTLEIDVMPRGTRARIVFPTRDAQREE